LRTYIKNIVICAVILIVFASVSMAVIFPKKHTDIIRSECNKLGVDQTLVQAVIWTESKYDKSAVSPVGAVGLMQLMPSTAYYLADMLGEQVDYEDLKKVEVSVRLGVFYLKILLDEFGDEKTALCAYNAGEGNVRRWLKEGSGIPFRETRDYVKRVAFAKKIYSLKNGVMSIWKGLE